MNVLQFSYQFNIWHDKKNNSLSQRFINLQGFKAKLTGRLSDSVT